MGDEHLNTIPATESDEFIKSSVENLVQNPSESEGKNGCDVPASFTTFLNILFDAEYEFDSVDDQSCPDEDFSEEIYSNPLFEEEINSMRIDQHHFNAEFDLIESLLNRDSSIIPSSLKIDSLLDEFAGELTLLKLILLGIDKTDCDPEEDIRLTKRLLYDNSSHRPPEEFVSENSEIESFSPSLIPNEDSDSHMEEIDLSFNPDDPMPSGIEDDDYDSERDMLILEELLDNYSLSLPENESFYFDILSLSRPPVKPADVQVWGNWVKLSDLKQALRGRHPMLISAKGRGSNFGAAAGEFPCIHPPPQETSIEILYDQENEINFVETFLRKFNCYSFFKTPKVLLLTWDRVFKIKDALGNKQYKPEDTQELFRELFIDVQNIHEELAEYINTLGWNHPAFYNNGDDDDEDCTIAITSDFLITDSLSMGDERLDTIPENKSDEFNKSNVEDLVPNPSEFEDECECDVPDCDDSQTTHLSTFSNPLFDDSTSSDDESSHEEVIHEISFKTYSNPLFDLDEEIISSEFNLIHNEDLDSTPKNDRFDTKSYLLESLLNHDESIPPGIDCDDSTPKGIIFF
nr:hypothetical protein [Tanacetum cinerariifolium]